MTDTVKRNSSFELMRIVSMLMIILWHIIIHGNIINNCSNEMLTTFFEFFKFFLIIHVNSFIIISGYFQSTTKFKMSKLIKNINLCWFYRVLILSILTAFRIWQPTQLEIFQQTFFIDIGVYWFMDLFIFLYCLSPFINIFLQKLKKLDFQKLLFTLFILFSIIPYFTGHKTFSNNGYTLYNFIYLYLIGAYFRQYSLQKEKIWANVSITKRRLFCINSFLILGITHYLLTVIAKSNLSTTNLISSEISSYVVLNSMDYSSPLVILQTVAYFLFFQSLSFQNKFINKISSLVIGVYLIHDHPVIRGNLYHWLKIDGRVIYSFKFIFYVAFCVIMIFVVCAFIEWLRQVLFKFIANLKISKWWRKTYREQIDKLGLEISW